MSKRATRIGVVILILLFLAGAFRQPVSASENTNKRILQIVLRPEKTEGEPDPDLAEPIRQQIREQLLQFREEERDNREEQMENNEDLDEELVKRLCACVSWDYAYDASVPAPGEKRPAGETPITLCFKEDADFAFRGWPVATDGEQEEFPTEETEEMTDSSEATEPSDAATEQTSEPANIPKPSTEKPPDWYILQSFLTTLPAAQGNTEERPTSQPEGQTPQEQGEQVPEVQTPQEQEEQVPQVRIPQEQHESAPQEQELQEQVPEAWAPQEPDRLEQELQVWGSKEQSLIQPQTVLTRLGQTESIPIPDSYLSALDTSRPESDSWQNWIANRPANDGIYQLTTTTQDIRGRPVTEKTRFSVNRFGSVYIPQKTTRQLIHKTVQQVTEDLLISEYNPDSLDKTAWQIEIYRDGQLLSNPRLHRTVRQEPKTAARRAGWYRADYQVSANNFREDGVYRILLSGKDMAGNESELHLYNGGEITFSVDHTPPELLETKGISPVILIGQSKTVQFSVFDAMGLSAVTLSVDGQIREQKKTFSDPHRADLSLTLGPGERQQLSLLAVDKAGNRLEKDVVLTIRLPEPDSGETSNFAWRSALFLLCLLLPAGGGFLLYHFLGQFRPFHPQRKSKYMSVVRKEHKRKQRKE